MKLHKKLKDYRMKRDMKLREVSEQTGLSISFISDIERGVTYPSIETAQKLASVYGVTLSQMFMGVTL